MHLMSLKLHFPLKIIQKLSGYKVNHNMLMMILAVSFIIARRIRAVPSEWRLLLMFELPVCPSYIQCIPNDILGCSPTAWFVCTLCYTPFAFSVKLCEIHLYFFGLMWKSVPFFLLFWVLRSTVRSVQLEGRCSVHEAIRNGWINCDILFLNWIFSSKWSQY